MRDDEEQAHEHDDDIEEIGDNTAHGNAPRNFGANFRENSKRRVYDPQAISESGLRGWDRGPAASRFRDLSIRARSAPLQERPIDDRSSS